jgi:hypothetical protein
MKHPWEFDPGLKNFPFWEIQSFQNETFLLGAYKYELEKYFKNRNVLALDDLDLVSGLDSRPRNLIITDLSTAERVFWNSQNSKVRNFANQKLLIPVCLGWLQMNWGVGFSAFESDLSNWWRWNIGDNTDGTIGLINRSKTVRRIRICFSIDHNFTSKVDFVFSLNNVRLNQVQDSEGYVFELNLKPGLNPFRILVDDCVSRKPNIDQRKLNYRVINFDLNGQGPDEGEFDLFARWQLHEQGYPYVKELSYQGEISVSDGFYNHPILEKFDNLAKPHETYSWYLASSVTL